MIKQPVFVGSTWVSGSGLLNTDGTERPALTWLVDFVKKNPDPPNDYPKLLAKSSVGTLPPETPFGVIPTSASQQSGRSLMKVYDLQGRVAGVFSINNRTPAVTSMAPVQGSYVIESYGGQGTVVNKIRYHGR